MKRTLPIRFVPRIALIALTALGAMSSARSELIQPVAVLVSHGEASQDALINGDGFTDNPGLGTPQSVHSRDAGQMWSGIGATRGWAVFDLGQTVSLTRVHIWNYNVTDQTDIGMKDVEIQVSADTAMDTASFNTIARVTLKEGQEKAQSFDVVGTSVRLVRLKALSNWGQGYTVGLAEARFETGAISGNVPTVAITTPRDGDEIALGADLAFDTRVTDRDGASDIAKVEYFDGDTLVTNRTVSPYAVTLKAPAKGDHAYRVVATDKSGKTAWMTLGVTVRQLVADRIIKIDDTRDEGTGLNQIRYVGTWNLAPGGASDPRFLNNDHYESNNNRNDYFEVRFRGVKIDIFSTVASHHGSAWASIDGGPEVKISYKLAQRVEQYFVWGSPILANREHVLKVRVFGDGVVTADRFDVSVSDRPDMAQASIQSVDFDEIIARMEDVGASVVDEKTLQITLDGAPVAARIVKAGAATTITYKPSPPFAPGSSHTLKIAGRDKDGAVLSSELAFNLPAPFFPLAGLGGPAGQAGRWGFRQIWNLDRIDAVVLAVDAALKANQPGFTGKLHDTSLPYIDVALSTSPGAAGLFPEFQPLPAEAQGLSANDFVLVGRATVRIPRTGDWTIGVHGDDGFALRFKGHPFDSVSGSGVGDENFPEYIGNLNPTGDSNTRGVLKALPAGDYEIEFISFQRVGGMFCEIYAAEGAFAEDGETDQWFLIGAPGGLEVVAPPVAFVLQKLARTGDQVAIDFQSPNPNGTHQLFESTDLKAWTPAAGATFTKTGGNGVRATVTGAVNASRFYRVRL